MLYLIFLDHYIRAMNFLYPSSVFEKWVTESSYFVVVVVVFSIKSVRKQNVTYYVQ